MALLTIRLSVWNEAGVDISDQRLDDLMAGSWKSGRHNFEAEQVLDGVRRLVEKATGSNVEVRFASEALPEFV